MSPRSDSRPLITKDIFAIIGRINAETGTTILVVEQNAAIALKNSQFAYIMELGRIVAFGPSDELMQKQDVKDFYLGDATALANPRGRSSAGKGERHGGSAPSSSRRRYRRPAIEVAGQDTPTKLFRARCPDWCDRPALRQKRKGIWHSFTWSEYYAHARAVGLALIDVGCRAGDVIAVLAENRPEWLFADLGAQCVGMIGTGIYPTSSPEQIEYVLGNSGARVLFVEDEEQLDKTLAIRHRCPDLNLIVVMDWTGLRDFSDPQVLKFEDFLARGSELARDRTAETFEHAIDAGRQTDTAFLVYTSGTTGAPKGAMISNRNVMFQLELVSHHLPVCELDHTVSFLPLCHIAERMATVFNQLKLGVIVHFPENSGNCVQRHARSRAAHAVCAATLLGKDVLPGRAGDARRLAGRA